MALYLRRTLHGCVDWNIFSMYWISVKWVAPYTGAWIEIWKKSRNWSICLVAPYTGAWIEISELVKQLIKCLSHPTRVRGLKYIVWQLWNFRRKSHPTRVRGLKFGNIDQPFVLIGRTLHGCVDWNYPNQRIASHSDCRTLHGCVDWNF